MEQQTDVWKQRMVTFEEKVNERLDIKDSSVPGFPDINFTNQRLSVDSDPFWKSMKRLLIQKISKTRTN